MCVPKAWLWATGLPTYTVRAPAPSVASTRRSTRSASANASSHDTATWPPSGRRTSGRRNRSGSSCRCPSEMPLGHRCPRDHTSSTLPRMDSTRPSASCTRSPHIASHSGQVTLRSTMRMILIIVIEIVERLPVSVQKSGEPARPVRPERDLFDDADTAAVTHLRADEVLQMDRREVGRLEVVESYRLATGFELAVVAAVAPVRVPVTDAAHAEGELLLDLDVGFAFHRIVEPQLAPPHLAAPRFPLELVADAVAFAHAGGAARGRAVRDRVQDERGLQPSAAVFVFVECQVGEAIPEVQRCPEPEDLERHGLAQHVQLFADGPDTPRAVAGAGHLGGVDTELVAVDGDRALPGAPLGEAGVVGEQDAFRAAALLARFLDRDGRGPEGEVAGDAVLVGLDDVADRPHRFGHLDADRTARRRPVERHGARGEDGMLDAVYDQAEGRVDDAADGIVTHRGAEVEGAVALVAVEPVAVVVVGVAGRRCGDRVGRRVDGEVVERAEQESSRVSDLH